MKRALFLALLSCAAACTRRDEAKPSPEAKPSAAAEEPEYEFAALTCNDGILGEADAGAPAVSDAAPIVFGDADLSGMVAPIGDGGVGFGTIGIGGKAIGGGYVPETRRTILSRPLGPRDARARAVAKVGCSLTEQIRTCHDDAGHPLGSVVLELAIDAAGAVTEAKTSGVLTDPKLTACLTAAFRARTFEPAAAGSTSYSITFSGPAVQTPTVKEAPTTVSGKLPPEVIRRVIRTRLGHIRSCYDKGLKANPALAGSISIAFVIGSKGAVTSATVESTTLGDPTVESCIAAVFTKMAFPEPESGTVRVTYPLKLNP